jgi:hypothetical protein
MSMVAHAGSHSQALPKRSSVGGATPWAAEGLQTLIRAGIKRGVQRPGPTIGCLAAR